MKRSVQLSALSREHHIALELALRLKRADTGDADAVRRAAVAFWDAECRRHFELEEALLLPVLARHTGADDPDIARTKGEHRELTARFGSLRTDSAVPISALNDTGALLSEHVRFEERVLFPRVEELLAPDELAELGAELEDAAPDHRIRRI